MTQYPSVPPAPPPATGVQVEDDGPVRIVTIDRPARRNAVDSAAACRSR